MVQDLSLHHHPVSSLFLTTDQCDAAGRTLSEEQIEFFHEYGYLKGVRILSDEQVEVLRNELARLPHFGHHREAVFSRQHDIQHHYVKRGFLHRFGRQTNQGEVVVEFDGRFYRIKTYDEPTG